MYLSDSQLEGGCQLIILGHEHKDNVCLCIQKNILRGREKTKCTVWGPPH